MDHRYEKRSTNVMDEMEPGLRPRTRPRVTTATSSSLLSSLAPPGPRCHTQMKKMLKKRMLRRVPDR
jgi:hypothetical protein